MLATFRGAWTFFDVLFRTGLGLGQLPIVTQAGLDIPRPLIIHSQNTGRHVH